MRRPIFHLALLCALATLAAGGGRAVAEEDSYDYEVWRQFWSFKPVTKPAPPPVEDRGWVRNPIDAFILARLEDKGAAPAPQADKLTLIRRATFDLTGLPPTLAEIEAFLADESPDAYEKLVQRLLQSPHYGERYGRHWLDVVRYEQGKVKLFGIKNTRGELAFRDYIVRAFNSDKPYNQLLTEHLAGDLLPATDNREQYFDQITAPAFLSIGNWFDECTDPNRLRLDIIDEQINVVSKAFMGLTISCARCHDHKFDPISERDYYALAGVFASTRIIDTFNENWKDGRVRLTREMAMPAEVARNDEIRAQIAAKRAQEWMALEAAHAVRLKKWKEDEAMYRELAAKAPAVEVHELEAEDFSGQSNLKISQADTGEGKITFIETQQVGQKWVKYEVRASAAGMYTFWARYTSAEPEPVSVRVGGRVQDDDALAANTGGWDWRHGAWAHLGDLELVEGVNTIRLEVKEGHFPRLDRLRWYATDELDYSQLLSLLQPAHPAWDRLDLLTLANFIISPDAPYLSVAEIATPYRVKGSSRDLRRLVMAYPNLITAADYDAPTDLPIHYGGDPYRASKAVVPRGAPTLFEQALRPPAMPDDRSGRLELATWLASPKHPLTARVMVNRLWQWHFGRGIVDSPNDFGSRGSPPSHPMLLDWLAATFVEEGWSMKRIHYFIMTSATYRQAGRGARIADGAADGASVPGPQLLGQFPRRRLEVEAIYDAMLATTGKVPRQQSGAALDFNQSADRMMYVLTANRSPAGLGAEIRKMFAVFGYDPTGEPVDQRDTSTTAAQSLFWLNNPIPKHFAGIFARELLAEQGLTDEQRLRQAYLIALAREPDRQIVADVLQYLENCEKDGMNREQAWTQVCLAIYASNAFRYLE